MYGCGYRNLLEENHGRYIGKTRLVHGDQTNH